MNFIFCLCMVVMVDSVVMESKMEIKCVFMIVGKCVLFVCVLKKVEKVGKIILCLYG